MSKHHRRSTMVACEACGRGHDATGSICRSCLAELRRLLVDLPAYWSDVDTVRAGQTRYAAANTGSPTRGRGEAPLGMDLRFAADGYGTRVLHTVRNTLVGWVRIGVEEHPEWGWPADTVPAMCGWLHTHAGWLRSSEHGPLALTELSAAVTSLRSLVDRPADRWYAGACGATLDDGSTCRYELRPRKPEGSLRCAACGTVHDIAARRRLLLDEARDRALPASDLARAIVWLGEYHAAAERLEDRIRAWVKRDRLFAWSHEVRVGFDGRMSKRPCYRVADVLHLLTEDAENATRRAGKSGARRRTA